MSRRPSRRTLTMIVAAVVVVGGVMFGVATFAGTGGSQSSPPGQPPGSTTLTTHPHRGGCDGLGICTSPGPKPAPCPSKPTPSNLVAANGTHLQSYATSCGQGKAIISAYTKFIGAYNQVLDYPYGNSTTPWQELGNVYRQEVQGTLKATQIPPGCTIPAPSAHAVSWPPKCDQLLGRTGNGDPLATSSAVLDPVATSTGVAQTLRYISHNLNAGYMTSGQLVTTGEPIIREIVGKGNARFATAPQPASPVSTWTPETVTTTAPSTAIVWACLASHLTATNRAGHHAQYAPYWAMNVELVSTNSGWLVNRWGGQTTSSAIAKGSPCGIAY